APLKDEVPVKSARRRRDRTSHVLYVSRTSTFVRNGATGRAAAGRPELAAGARSRPGAPGSAAGRIGLSARAAADRHTNSPIGHPGRSEEAPQSFDLYGSGQKVGGDISGGSEQVKGRWKPVSTIRRANWCSVSAFLRGRVALAVELLQPAQLPGVALEEFLLEPLACRRVAWREAEPIAVFFRQLVRQEVIQRALGHLGQGRLRPVPQFTRPRQCQAWHLQTVLARQLQQGLRVFGPVPICLAQLLLFLDC